MRTMGRCDTRRINASVEGQNWGSKITQKCLKEFITSYKSGLLTLLASKIVPQPVPPCFRLDLHCSYHQGPRHDIDHYNALRHAIQDFIDQGLVNLGQPSVTTNPLPTHSTRTVLPPLGDIHHMTL